MYTIDWIAGGVLIIEQTSLPGRLRRRRLRTVDDLIGAVQKLSVRGAPALGVAGALGVALAAHQHGVLACARAAKGIGGRELLADIERVRTARPTAVNLARGVDRAATRLADGPPGVLAEALALRDEEIAASASMAAYGADLVTELCGTGPALLTHCNTGALASVTGGTALGVVFELHRRGALREVFASETRPLLQGSRLTAWELAEADIPFRVVVDGAGPFLMARGQVDAVILGADRICANGDVVNKVGSYSHALGAARAGVPFLVVAPESTVDMNTATGADVPIEDRDPAEVLELARRPIAPEGAGAVNPAFDITPHDLVTAIVTDHRVIRLDLGQTLADVPPGELRAGPTAARVAPTPVSWQHPSPAG